MGKSCYEQPLYFSTCQKKSVESRRNTRFPREYVLSSSKVSVSKRNFLRVIVSREGYISFFWRLKVFFMGSYSRHEVLILDGKF